MNSVNLSKDSFQTLPLYVMYIQPRELKALEDIYNSGD